MADVTSWRVVRLEPDTKAAESLSRRIWKGSSKMRGSRYTAGRKVYQHAREESRKG